MATYTITLTDEEDIALHHVAVSAQEWIENAVRQRCSLAMNEIVDNHVKTQLAAGLPLAGTTHAEIIKNITVETAAARHDRVMAEYDAQKDASKTTNSTPAQ
jgi:hypothetical protein